MRSTDNGKPVERRGRNDTGLPPSHNEAGTVAGPPKRGQHDGAPPWHSLNSRSLPLEPMPATRGSASDARRGCGAANPGGWSEEPHVAPDGGVRADARPRARLGIRRVRRLGGARRHDGAGHGRARGRDAGTASQSIDATGETNTTTDGEAGSTTDDATTDDGPVEECDEADEGAPKDGKGKGERGGEGDVDAACAATATHPSLVVLCWLHESGKLPQQAQATIGRVILEHAQKGVPGWAKKADHGEDDEAAKLEKKEQKERAKAAKKAAREARKDAKHGNGDGSEEARKHGKEQSGSTGSGKAGGEDAKPATSSSGGPGGGSERKG